jgi:hypothetical protein
MQLRHEFGVADLLEPIDLASEFLNLAVESFVNGTSTRRTFVVVVVVAVIPPISAT